MQATESSAPQPRPSWRDEMTAAFRAGASRGELPDPLEIVRSTVGLAELPLAPTPNEVVYRKEKIKLLRYAPAKQTHKTPILFVYSLINRHYILDFLPGRSLIEYLLGQGFLVYCIDWGRPTHQDRGLAWEDYVDRYLKRCVRQVLRDSGADDLTMYGYCMGGTLALAYAALYPEGLRSFVAQALPVRFQDSGLLSSWTDGRFFNADALVDANGNVPMPQMEAAFRSMDLVGNVEKWRTFAKRLDDADFLTLFLSMETWAADNVEFPGEAYRQYIKHCYQTEDFMEGRMVVGDRRIDLGRVSCPVLNIIAERDTIVPPESAAELTERVSSEDKTTLRFRCGHIGLVTSSKAPKRFWPQIASWIADHSESC